MTIVDLGLYDNSSELFSDPWLPGLWPSDMTALNGYRPMGSDDNFDCLNNNFRAKPMTITDLELSDNNSEWFSDLWLPGLWLPDSTALNCYRLMGSDDNFDCLNNNFRSLTYDYYWPGTFWQKLWTIYWSVTSWRITVNRLNIDNSPYCLSIHVLPTNEGQWREPNLATLWLMESL